MAETINLGNSYWAVKDNSLLAYNNENGNYKPLPFDFTRASTATVVNKAGLIETIASGEPRIDYSNDANGALLLEPQSTNLITYSEDFSNASWNKTRGTFLSNQAISPDGNLTADKFTETADTGFHATSVNTTVTSGVSHTFSVFIKKGSINFIQFLFGTNNVNGNPYVNFDVNQGIYQNNGTTSANIENYGNGWYKCSVTFTTATTIFTNFISPIQSISDSRVSTFTGDVNNNVYIYGAQLEQNSYATSYIPTLTGTTQTRVAETCGGAGDSSSINSEEGVLYAEISTSTDSTDKAINISDSTGDNRIWIGYSTSNKRVYALGYSSGSLQFVLFKTLTDESDFIKIALKYKENDFQLWVDGSLVGSDLIGATPIGLSKLGFDLGFSSGFFYGNTKDLRVYSTALTDSELQALTTL